MARSANQVKPDIGVVCPACGATQPAPDVAKAKVYRPISARQILLNGILWALDEGPATPREIEDRMGLKPKGSETSCLLRQLERKKEVRIAGTQRARSENGAGNVSFVWERCFLAPSL